jgi:hypothetical protein
MTGNHTISDAGRERGYQRAVRHLAKQGAAQTTDVGQSPLEVSTHLAQVFNIEHFTVAQDYHGLAIALLAYYPSEFGVRIIRNLSDATTAHNPSLHSIYAIEHLDKLTGEIPTQVVEEFPEMRGFLFLSPERENDRADYLMVHVLTPWPTAKQIIHANERYRELSDRAMVRVVGRKIHRFLDEALGLHPGVADYITSSR